MLVCLVHISRSSDYLATLNCHDSYLGIAICIMMGWVPTHVP